MFALVVLGKRVNGEWFPNHILNDEMGMLDHDHYPLPNFDDVEEV